MLMPRHRADPAAAPEVLVVGAGPAGLAAAAAIGRRGMSVRVLERTDRLAAPWHEHYEGIRLQSPRQMSHLSGLRFGRSAGRWVSGPKFLDYLARYVDRHAITIEHGTEVLEIRQEQGGWALQTPSGVRRTAAVVVAAGYNHAPRIPNWPGLDEFAGTFLHSSRYRRAADLVGRDVLVIGTGNSGGEIASQLALGGARRVRLAIRTAPHVVPKSVMGVPTLLAAAIAEHLPVAAADRMLALLNDPIVGDLTHFGLPAPTRGMYSQYLVRGVTPIIDTGFLEALRTRRIECVPAVTGFDGRAVELLGGGRIEPEVVIAATGYDRRLASLVHVPEALTAADLPVADAAPIPGAPGLFFLGYTHPFSGNLRHLRRTGPPLGQHVHDYLRRGQSPAAVSPAHTGPAKAVRTPGAELAPASIGETG